MRCVLVGNYSVGNIGDEALKEYFLSEFPDISWSVVSANPTDPRDVPRLPLGIRSLFTNWWKTINAIRHADALIFGGGSLFTDIESVWACVIWRAYALLASWCKVPVMLAFQGAGPCKINRCQTPIPIYCTRWWMPWRVTNSSKMARTCLR